MSPLVIEREAILELAPDQYAQLVRDGACEWTYDEMEYPNGTREVRPVTDLYLAFDQSRSNFWFEFEPEADLNLLLDWSCLATYDVTTKQLRRTGASSLREELTLRMNANASPATASHDEPRPFAPVKGRGQDGYDHWIRPSAFETWQQTGTLFGQLSVCGCQFAGCGATYAWLTGRTGLLVVVIGGSNMFAVEIGPFPIVDVRRDSR
jgi:hypothetical protein